MNTGHPDDDRPMDETDSTPADALAKAWREGHEAGFWNGRESSGNTEMPLVGIKHAEATNPYGKGTEPPASPTQLPARELNATHLGKTVTATHNGTTITGPLQAISHESDLIDDTSFQDSWAGVRRLVLGQPRSTATIAPDHHVALRIDAEVEVAE